MRFGCGAVALVMAALVTSACSSGAQREGRSTSDAPILVPWHRIGDISLGESKRQIERRYGSEGHGYHVLVKAQGLEQGYYRLHGGKVSVTFDAGRVRDFSFATRYYRTKSGFGVGSRISLGPCHRKTVGIARCEHRWHGFIWQSWDHDQPCHCWTKVGLGETSHPATVENFLRPWFIIYVRHGRVSGFYFNRKYVD